MTPEAASFETAQAQADIVYQMLGSAAPRPMAGETAYSYRVRLARGIQKHSTAFKTSDLSAIARADAAAFNFAERTIFEEVRKFAGTSGAVADGELRAHEMRSSAGHHITTYTGDPFAWMSAHMLRPKRVRIASPKELAR
jgi:hypothetical protein